MQNRIAHGLASVLLVVSLGAAQGPTSSGSKDTQTTTPRNTVTRSKSRSRTTTTHHQPYQLGTASWYGESFEGRATASGEPYKMHELTAAHPTLPLGSWVRVTNLHNGRVVYVRINDRGPIVPGRIRHSVVSKDHHPIKLRQVRRSLSPDPGFIRPRFLAQRN